MSPQVTNAAAGAQTDGGERATRELSLLIDVIEVAALLHCSARHVYRLSDARLMPRPFKIGSLCRWDRAAIQQWVRDGCPPCREGGAR